jgi:hypothetical protein
VPRTEQASPDLDRDGLDLEGAPERDSFEEVVSVPTSSATRPRSLPGGLLDELQRLHPTKLCPEDGA